MIFEYSSIEGAMVNNISYLGKEKIICLVYDTKFTLRKYGISIIGVVRRVFIIFIKVFLIYEFNGVVHD